MISFQLEDDVLAIQDTVRKFAETELRAKMREAEEAGEVSDALVRSYQELGLSTLELPEALGGLELGMITRVVVEEELAFGDPAMAAAIDRSGFISYALLELGTEAQKKEHLREGLSGTVGIWEPGQSESFTELETTIREEGDEVRITGRKSLVANAGLVDWYVILGTIDRARGWEGVRAVLVPKDAAGLTIGPPEQKSGLWALRTAEVTLEDVRVPKANVLSGASALRDGIERLVARLHIVSAARAVGTARAAYEYALHYAAQRQAFGQAIANHQAIAFMLADMSILVDSARVLVWQGAALIDKAARAENGNRPGARKECAQALVQANTVAVKVTIDAVQVLGGAGFIRDYPCEKWMRDARTLSLLCGSDQAQNQLIAEHIMAA
jgi:alkylation response protein AidB-like acyl-CoA dehydrogenase